jgi:hypothetical protein
VSRLWEKGGVHELTISLLLLYCPSQQVFIRELFQVLGNSSMTSNLFGILRSDSQRARV